MRILISAGEVSGDIAGARVTKAILERSDGYVFGLGGARMDAAGVELLAPATHLGTVGVSESLRAIPAMLAPALAIRRTMRENPPDVALLIGNDIFNVLLGRWCRAAGVPTVSYFPPQVWIWRSLAWFFSMSFDVVVASFPEEVEAYEGHVRTEFVGHYLTGVLEPQTEENRAAAREHLGLERESRVVAVLPGSRIQEIRGLVPTFVKVVGLVARHHPDVRFLLPISDRRFADEISSRVESSGLRDRIAIVEDSHLSMYASDLVLTASGTASLEATLIGIPMVVAYRVSRLTHGVVKAAIMAGLMRGETVALPNLLLGREVVPELTQSRATVAAISAELLTLLEEPERRRRMCEELRAARESISRPRVIDRVVDVVLNVAARGPAAAPVAEATRPVVEPHATRGRS